MIRLRFVTEAGFGAALIRWRCGNGLYSHVGALTDDGSREFGARAGIDGAPTGKPGLQYRPAGYAEFARSTVVAIPCTAEERKLFWSAARAIDGAGYSMAEIFGDAVGVALDVHGRFVCSAAMHWMLTRARMTDFNERGRSRLITPDWLYGFSSGLRNGRLWGMT